MAHDDIRPTRDWEDEIIHSLRNVDILIALLTPDFRNSEWTDQEIGAAVGRGLPVVPIDLGMTPYGFLGKFQAIRGKSVPMEDAADYILQQLLETGRPEIHGLIVNSFIVAMSRLANFNSGERLAKIFPLFKNLSENQLSAIVAAHNSNRQVNGSGHFNDLAQHLTTITVRSFKQTHGHWESKIEERDPISDFC